MDISLLFYGGVYLLGFLLYALSPSQVFSKAVLLEIAVFAADGAIVGGRLGYVIFYEPLYYIENPIEIVQIWKGGMSFHGGVIGLIFGCYCYVLIKKLPVSFLLRMIDRACIVALVIIPLGRLSNFMNGELWGRVTSVPWGVIFAGADENPRHPVQLYEALCEGPLMAMALFWLHKKGLLQKNFMISVFYLIFYCTFRFFTEFFREPDRMLGYIGLFTMGQILCLLGLSAGIVCAIVMHIKLHNDLL